MGTRIVNRGGEITVERTGEDLRHLTDDELDAFLIERKDAVAAAREWSNTARTALITAAKDQPRGSVVWPMGVGTVRSVAVDVADSTQPAHLRQLQAASTQADRDEAAAKVALSSVRDELKHRRQREAATTNAARHERLVEEREQARQQALRDSVNAVARKPTVRDRIDQLIGR